MLSPNILFLWPPAGSIQGPPFGLMAVAGAVRSAIPHANIRMEDLNVQSYKHILSSFRKTSDIGKILRLRWTQAEIVQSALSFWVYGKDSLGVVGALSNWECRYLSVLFSDVLDGAVDGLTSTPDIIGISVCDNGLVAAIGLSKKLREKFPQTIIIWGGVSVCEDQAPSILKNIPEINAIVVGEGEQAFIELVNSLPEPQCESIAGVISRHSQDNKKIKAVRKRYLPYEPAYDLCDLSLYPALELPMSIGRGCAWGRCVFCNENYASSEFQEIDPKRSAQWALQWQKKFHPVSFELVDSAANSRRKLLGLFVKELIEYGGLREWRCMMRTRGLVKEELLQAVQSGLRTVYFGIESLNDEVLKTMNKGETVIDHIRAFRIALECKLKIEGDLILFFPTDTAERVENASLIFEKYDHLFQHVNISFSRFVPATNTQIALHPQKYGIRILSSSLLLSSHLPLSLTESFTPWDPKWEYQENESIKVKELAPAYLNLQEIVQRIKLQKPVYRTWYELDQEIILETFGHENEALERLFLTGIQCDIWQACESVISSDKLAVFTGVEVEQIEEFLGMLMDKGFIFGSSSQWTQAALYDSRFCPTTTSDSI